MFKFKSNGTVKSLLQAGDSIGGRNLLLGSATNTLSSTGTSGYLQGKNFTISCDGSELQGRTVVISAKFDAINAIAVSVNDYHRIGLEMTVNFADGSVKNIGVWMNFTSTPRTEHNRLSRVYTIQDKEITSVGPIRIYHQYLLSDSAKVSEAKVEFGAIPTDWSPAPEDIDSRLTALEAA